MPPEEQVEGEGQSYHPNMKPKENGLYCFMDMSRPCGADCMSYANPPMTNGPDYDDKQWANCILLVAVHQGGKHSAVIANVLVNIRRTQVTPAVPKVG